ncbi:MAG: right-handed parallel beta-helix repeat-containing protein, partial [Candidatus Thorarchaeota archaeon]
MKSRGGVLVILMVLLIAAIPFPVRYSESIVTGFASIELTENYTTAYIEHSPIIITSDADFIAQDSLEGWPGTGSPSNPIIIDRYNITHRGYCIRIENVGLSFHISNCYLNSNSSEVLTDAYDHGISLSNVGDALLTFNKIVNKEDCGIYIESSNIHGGSNELIDNYRGIVFDHVSGIFYSNDITNSTDISVWIIDSFDLVFRQHQVSSNLGAGMLMQGTTDCTAYNNDFDNGSVELRDCNNCEMYNSGFYNGSEILITRCSQVSVTNDYVIAPSDQGILINQSSHCTISNNRLNSSTKAAIVVLDSFSCNITSNIISHCQDGIRIGSDTSSSLITNNYIFNQIEYGIRIDSGSDNWIYANLVVCEGAGFFLDDGSENHWDDGFFLGNFLPGITEGTLQIDGSAGSQDQFARPVDPEPIEEPVICSGPILVKIDNFEGILTCVIWVRTDTWRYGYYIVNWVAEIDGERTEGVDCSDLCTIMVPIPELEAGIHEVRLILELHVIPMLEGEIDIANVSFFLPGFYSSYDGDNDGMVDEWEVENGLNPLIDDGFEDPDNDNLDNNQEIYWSTDPHNPDTDQDQMPDGWEALYELRPLLDDSREDKDSDGLCNLDEYLHGTDPDDSDSDSDSITDGWEVTFGQNPLDPTDAWIDSDADTLTNLQEFLLGTDPTSPDSDRDSYPDAWEVQNGFDPLAPPDTMYEEMVYFAPFIITGYLTIGAISVVT